METATREEDASPFHLYGLKGGVPVLRFEF
jgi:hypothetical protein